MANADARPQTESTTCHGQVHDDKPLTANKWANATIEAAVAACDAALASGQTAVIPVASWLGARESAQAALRKLVAAVEFGATHWHESVMSAATPREQQAAEVLEREGWAWRIVPGLDWVAPPDPLARLEVAAAKVLRGMGYEWDGGAWKCTKPAPSVLDQPLGVPVVIGRGNTNAARFGPETPVRALLEYAEARDAQERRLLHIVHAADDALADAPDHPACDAARRHLRGK